MIKDDTKSRRQRQAIRDSHGELVVGLDFEGFADGHISMWQHVDHGMDYAQTRELIKKMRDHLDRFIEDESMCPFNPEFKNLSADE